MWVDNTVNSEIFARVLFSRNFAYAKFRENKTSRIREITLPFTFIGKSRLCREFQHRKYVLNAILAILAKISEFTASLVIFIPFLNCFPILVA